MLRSNWIQGLKKAGAVLAMGAMLTACGGGNSNSEDALAVYKVNAGATEEQTVSQEDFDSFLDAHLFLNPQMATYREVAAFQKDMLDQYMGFQILASRLEGDAREEAEKKAEEDLAVFEEAMGDTIAEELKKQDVKMADIEEYAKQQTLAVAYLEQQVKDEELRKQYDDSLTSNPNVYTLATVSHILIGTKDPATQEEKRTQEEALKIANEVRDKLLGGADFAEMVTEYSEDEGSKATGGTYADANVNGWVEGFKEAALELPLNEISQPVETTYGYHIMKVSDRKVQTFEDVKESLKSQVLYTKFSTFMSEELPELVVENNLPEEAPATEEGAAEDGAGDAADQGTKATE